MSRNAKKLLEWKNFDSERKALVFVRDLDKKGNEKGSAWLEIIEYHDETWQTDEKIADINAIEDISLPKSLLP